MLGKQKAASNGNQSPVDCITEAHLLLIRSSLALLVWQGAWRLKVTLHPCPSGTDNREDSFCSPYTHGLCHVLLERYRNECLGESSLELHQEADMGWGRGEDGGRHF